MWFLMLIVLSTTPHQTWPIAGTATMKECVAARRAAIAEVKVAHSHLIKRAIKLECQR